jgi:adenine-specific DNA-methyltransferase
MYPSLNYLGSKVKLLDFINESITSYTKKELSQIDSFLDGFTGTGSVSYSMLKNGISNVTSNDIQYYSYIASSNFLEKDINKEKLKKFIIKLNKGILKEIVPENYFIYHNYSTDRKYFTPENGKIIDFIRQSIETEKEKNMITNNEYQILIKLLLFGVSKVANIASVYGAYLKQYKPSSKKKLVLDPELLELLLPENKSIHKNYNDDIITLIKKLPKIEVVYYDSPYNQRGYNTNFHLLETIARYDNPEIKGITGLRADTSQKSNFCSKVKVSNEFLELFKHTNCHYIFVSYSSDGIISKEKLTELLEIYFTNVVCFEKDYRKFKSNTNVITKNIIEYLFAGTSKSV